MMQLLNPARASGYLDTIRDQRPRSAVLAIHLAWLDHSSPRCQGECSEPEAPLDLLILYQAAAATFRDWPPLMPTNAEDAPGSRVINHQQATQRLLSVGNEETRILASIFVRYVIALSSTAASEQDLDYYVQLFLKSIRDKWVIDNIASGTISQHSVQLSDPNLW